MKKAVIFMCVLLFSAVAFFHFGNDILIALESDDVSVRLPTSGNNFETYSRTLSTMGRTHVHSKLKPALLDAYKALEKTLPQVTWSYAETGWKNGGNFWPHHTHQNGLSVDFIVPVNDTRSSKSTMLALSPLNLWGYRVRFDKEGCYKQYQIDFASMILHLRALKDSCIRHKIALKRVIFDPPLLAKLRSQPTFHLISDLPFMKGPAWFPHDSHYHVDFARPAL